MDYWKVCAEIIGFVASILFLYSSSLTDDKKLTFFYTLGCFVLAAHLSMLGAFAGAATTSLSAIRNIITQKYRYKEIKVAFLLLFLGIFIYYVINHTYWYEILIPLASLVMAIGFIYLKKNGLSACIFLSCSLWLIYGISINSYSIMFLELSTIISVSIRFIKQNELFDFAFPKLNIPKIKLSTSLVSKIKK